MNTHLLCRLLPALAAAGLALSAAAAAPVEGWLSWRGPNQDGVSPETGLPDTLAIQDVLWTADFPGGSTAVIANGRLYIVGYLGDGTELQEGISCFNAESGELEWRHLFNDFLSDIIYNRYATSSPAVDPQTGNVYLQGTQGLLIGFSPDGKILWQRSLMEDFGRLTFPNGRTATPVVDGNLVITRGITANWGTHGPGGDRFYAFDKNSGQLVWASTPAGRPKDSCFSYPYLAWTGNKRVFYATAGDGSVVCGNARIGDEIWQVPLGKAGINASVLIHNNDKAIAIYGTPYEPGQMVAMRLPDVAPTEPGSGPIIVEREQVELWSANISTSTSSPILVGDTIYVVAEKGDLCAVDANTGRILWTVKLGIEQRNSCPVYADGKLYVPILEDPDMKQEAGTEAGTKGALYVIQPGPEAGKILSKVTLDGRCFGSPTPFNGKIYMQTTRKLYCFGTRGNNSGLKLGKYAADWPEPGPATRLQIIPSEVALQPGGKASFKIVKIDAAGNPVETVEDVSKVTWNKYLPPTARVKASLSAAFNAQGELVAESASAGAFEASLGNLKGYIRGRVLPGIPFSEGFDSFELDQVDPATETDFAYPPLPWIGARFKFNVRDLEGNKALAKTVDNKFFQRATVFLGEAEMRNYTIEADVMSDGNRRKMSDVGVINQRYLIILKGNEQKLEISSNQERLRVPAAQDPPNLRWKPNEWMRLKARVDTAPAGQGIIRAKAWPKSEPEPTAWTLEVTHQNAHRHGSPGLFGFSPQDMPVYIDNVRITQNN